jgi:hypothetical protein
MMAQELSERGALEISDFRSERGPVDERRKEPRAKKSKTVALMRGSDEEGFENAELEDCSLHGVGITTSEGAVAPMCGISAESGSLLLN